jgi:hypothetical protein
MSARLIVPYNALWVYLICYFAISHSALAAESETHSTTFEIVLRYLPWPTAVVAVVALVVAVAPQEVRDLISRLSALSFKGVDAKFDKVAEDAFTVAARAINNRSKGNPYEFTTEDLEAAKTLSALTTRYNKSKIETIVHGLADEYTAMRAKEGPGPERNRLMSIALAKMRIMAFAGRHMIGQLTRAERAGERIVAITFLQVDAGSHPDLFGWLAERVYKEEPFVQYHAARAMLAICRVAEPSRIFEYTAIVKAASAVFKELPQDKRMEHPELFDWCLSSLQGRPAFNPAPLTPQTTL